MSRSLIKLVDNSLLPAALMVIGKFVGVIVVIQLFNISTSIREYSNSLFSYSTILKPEDVLTVTTYSDLIMYAVLAIGFSVNIFRAVYLHSSHIKPTLVSRLVNKNLFSLIQNSYEIYHSAAIWLVFVLVSNVLIIVNAINGSTYPWLAVVTVIASALLTTVLLQDVYREIENIKHHPGDYHWE